VFLKIPNNFCSSIKKCLFHKNVNVQIRYFDLYFSAVFEVALVQLVAGVALIGSLDRVALGLDLLDLCLPGDGTQFGQDRSGIDLTVGHQATLLQETVGKALHLGIGVPEVAGAQGNSLLLGDSFLFGTGLGPLSNHFDLGRREFLEGYEKTEILSL